MPESTTTLKLEVQDSPIHVGDEFEVRVLATRVAPAPVKFMSLAFIWSAELELLPHVPDSQWQNDGYFIHQHNRLVLIRDVPQSYIEMLLCRWSTSGDTMYFNQEPRPIATLRFRAGEVGPGVSVAIVDQVSDGPTQFNNYKFDEFLLDVLPTVTIEVIEFATKTTAELLQHANNTVLRLIMAKDVNLPGGFKMLQSVLADLETVDSILAEEN